MELTKEQNDLCYKLKLSIIRAIVHTDNELIWEIVKREIEKEGCVKPQPTIEERPKGKWIYNKIGYPYVYTCSECGYHNDIKNRFCPYCGADMRGEENDN